MAISSDILEKGTCPHISRAITAMSGSGYDAVVDVDDEVRDAKCPTLFHDVAPRDVT